MSQKRSRILPGEEESKFATLYMIWTVSSLAVVGFLWAVAQGTLRRRGVICAFTLLHNLDHLINLSLLFQLNL